QMGCEAGNLLRRFGRAAQRAPAAKYPRQKTHGLEELEFATAREERFLYRITCSPARGGHCFSTPLLVLTFKRQNEFTAAYNARNRYNTAESRKTPDPTY